LRRTPRKTTEGGIPWFGDDATLWAILVAAIPLGISVYKMTSLSFFNARMEHLQKVGRALARQREQDTVADSQIDAVFAEYRHTLAKAYTIATMKWWTVAFLVLIGLAIATLDVFLILFLLTKVVVGLVVLVGLAVAAVAGILLGVVFGKYSDHVRNSASREVGDPKFAAERTAFLGEEAPHAGDSDDASGPAAGFEALG
jgi:hypothetical protein